MSSQICQLRGLEQRVAAGQPLREIRRLADVVLNRLDAPFDALYASSGRPSIALEYVLRALLLQAFYASFGASAGLKPAVSVVRGAWHG